MIKTRTALAIAAAALVVGGLLGIAGDRWARSETASSPSAVVRGEATLDRLPAEPVTARVETLLLPAGTESILSSNSAAVVLVDSGTVEVEAADSTAEYGPGEMFVKRVGDEYTVTVKSAARISVLRLLSASPGTDAS